MTTVSRATAVVLLLATATVTAEPTTLAPSATRLVVKVDERRFVPIPNIETIVLVEENVVRVAATPGGFDVQGIRTGQTLAQVFTRDGLRVMVLVVEAAAIVPIDPRLTNHSKPRGERLPLTSFWGANSYTVDAQQSTQLGFFTTHTLKFSGLVNKGEYNADLQATAGVLGNGILRAHLGWANEARTASFDLGDTTALLTGSQVVSAIPIRGLKVRAGNDYFSREIYLGGMVGYGSLGFEQPVLGGSIQGMTKPEVFENIVVRYGSSALAFVTSGGSAAPGRVGILASADTVVEHKKGFSLGVHSAGIVSSPMTAGATESALEGGLAGNYRAPTRSASLRYDFVVGRFYQPLTKTLMGPSHRWSASYSQRLTAWMTGSAAGSYQVLWDGAGHLNGGLSVSLALQIALSAQTRLDVQAAQITSQFTSGLSPNQTIVSLLQRTAGVGISHQFSAATQAQLQIGYQHNEAPTSVRDALSAIANVGHQVSGSWDVSGFGTLTGYRNSVLAVEQPPLVVQASTGATGRFIVGNLESFGGFSLQTNVIGPSGVGGSVNVGIRFAPTVAHRFVANVTLTQPPGNSGLVESAAISYTYQFGDSIKTPPLFEFTTHGEVHGIVCLDDDLNGECTADEAPIAGVNVRLSDGQTMATDSNGAYRFRGVAPGWYHIDVDEAGLRHRGRLTTPSTATMEMLSNGQLVANFGVGQGCSLLGRIVNDLDMDGVGTEKDVLVGGVRVTATGEGARYESASDAFGVFEIRLKKCGEYSVQLETDSLPASMRVVVDHASARTTMGEPQIVKLLVASIRTIEGTVFLDSNRNGKKDPGEPTVAHARVTAGEGSATTDGEGAFLLRRLPAGKVRLTVAKDSLAPGLEPGVVEVELPVGPAAIEVLELPVSPGRPSTM